MCVQKAVIDLQLRKEMFWLDMQKQCTWHAVSHIQPKKGNFAKFPMVAKEGMVKLVVVSVLVVEGRWFVSMVLLIELELE